MMQIDTSMYNTRPTSLAQGLGALAGGFRSLKQAKLQDIAMQNEQLKLDQMRKKMEREEALRTQMQDIQGRGSLDPMDVDYLSPEQVGQQQMQAYAAANPIEMMSRGLKGSEWAQSAQRPGWSFNKRTGEWKKNEDVSQDIDPYKQELLNIKKQNALEAKARREQAKDISDRTYAFEREKHSDKLEELKASRGDKIFNKANKLSKFHYDQSKEFIKQRNAYDRVSASAIDPSPAGDLALIFNYMKVLDPGSTVREGEFATAQNSGSVDDRTRSLYNRIVSGQRLSEDQRKDFVDRSGKLFGKALKNQDKLDKAVKQKAKLFKIPENLVFYDYRSASEEGAPVVDYGSMVDEVLSE